jgi:hypothetical protein
MDRPGRRSQGQQPRARRERDFEAAPHRRARGHLGRELPRTPSWLLSVRWLIEDGVTVKKGDRVVEFDSSSFAGTLEDKRVAVVRTGNEMGKADSWPKSRWRSTARRPSWRRPTPRPASPEIFTRAGCTRKNSWPRQKRDALAKGEEELAANQRREGCKYLIGDQTFPGWVIASCRAPGASST